ncbi:MAG: hypothetical protein IPP34_08135 [Bacteroidetes bacterium]|nr:hypothetical protein [Bacteroidota bacterium]
MKKIILLFAMLFVCLGVQAQYYYYPYTYDPGINPGGLNNDDEYPVGGGLATTWTTIQGSSATPAWSAVQTIPVSI